jgi:hypothetical protein
MKLLIRLAALAAAIAICISFTYSLHSQDTKSTTKSKANPNHPSGAFNPDSAKALAGSQNITLQRARDYHHSGGNVDCPNCKDMYSALIVVPGGAKITAISTTGQRPTANNHWYRCQKQASCGRPEFSDPNDSRLDCIGKSQCFVNRASDDGVGNYEDDISVTYQ